MMSNLGTELEATSSNQLTDDIAWRTPDFTRRAGRRNASLADPTGWFESPLHRATNGW
jgi:hypothetical protein